MSLRRVWPSELQIGYFDSIQPWSVDLLANRCCGSGFFGPAEGTKDNNFFVSKKPIASARSKSPSKIGRFRTLDV